MKKILIKRKHKAVVIVIFIIFVFSTVLYKVDRDLKPVLMALCDAEARVIASETINNTIREEFGNKISYDDIMTVKTDKEGNVVMIQANTVELNRIGSQVALGIQKRIDQLGGRGVKIPLGLLFNNDLLAYYGPKITFNMQPFGSTSTSYSSDFKAAGINQTRQIIYLNVTASIQVIIPTTRNNISITSSIPIAESIIVGKVPTYYSEGDGKDEANGLTLYGIPKK